MLPFLPKAIKALQVVPWLFVSPVISDINSMLFNSALLAIIFFSNLMAISSSQRILTLKTGSSSGFF
nr:MAG TPA: hypothetical protein [Caudoviricetes sp.]